MNKESIRANLATIKLKEETVEAWGQQFTIRQINTKIGLAAGQQATNGNGAPDSRYVSIISSVIDPETKEFVFTDADIPMLEELPLAGTLTLVTAINELNGFQKAAEIQKN